MKNLDIMNDTELRKFSEKNYEAAKRYFIAKGQLPSDRKERKNYCLHHWDPTLKKNDSMRYHEWRVDDLVVMTMSEHTALHNRLRGKWSDEVKQKISNSMKGKEPWNKGKTLPDDYKKKISDSVKENWKKRKNISCTKR